MAANPPRRTKPDLDINDPNWGTTVLRKGDAKRSAPPPPSRAAAAALDGDDVRAPRKGGLTLGMAMQRARTKIKVDDDSGGERPMTQIELDAAAGVPRGTVKKYENGSAIYNPETVNEIARALGVKLPRPPKKAKSRD